MKSRLLPREEIAFVIPTILASILILSGAFLLLAPLLHFERARLVVRHNRLIDNVIANNQLIEKLRTLRGASPSERQEYLKKQDALLLLAAENESNSFSSVLLRRKFFSWPGRAPSWSAFESNFPPANRGGREPFCLEWQNSTSDQATPNLIASANSCHRISPQMFFGAYVPGNLLIERNTTLELAPERDASLAVLGSIVLTKELFIAPGQARSLTVVAIGDISIGRIKRNSESEFTLSLISLTGGVSVNEFSNTWNLCSNALEMARARLFVSAPQEVLLGPSVRTAGQGIGCNPPLDPQFWPEVSVVAQLEN